VSDFDEMSPDRYTDEDWARFLELAKRTSRLAEEAEIVVIDADLKIEEWIAVCTYCMAPLPTKIDEEIRAGFHVDHIVPKSRAGSNHPDNLAISCSTCNLRKRARTPAEWYVAERRTSRQGVEEEFPGLVLVALQETYDNIGGLPPRRDPTRPTAASGPNSNALRELDGRLPAAGRLRRFRSVNRFLEGT
jgi:hypothetical protein